MSMRRFKLIIEYDGRPFVGWQRQDNGPSVQGEIEKALLKFLPEDYVPVTGSGRTDAGVHALGQVAHFDTARIIGVDEVQGALNYHLKDVPVSIQMVQEVGEDFNARFSAIQRHYVYKIVNRRAPLTWDSGLKWQVKTDLDASAMHEAAQLLVGQHDFTTFRHAHCQAKSPIKTLDYLEVERMGDEVHIRAGARSFLHHQIRSITGTLKTVGTGQWTKKDVEQALAAKNRDALPFNAPPDGLYFLKVDY